MVKRWAKTETIDGKLTVTNIVIANDEYAEKYGLIPAAGLEIAAEWDGDKFVPKPKKHPSNPLKKLVKLLLSKQVITKQEARELLDD